MVTPTYSSIEIAGAELHVRRVGKGAPVLLTHGIPGDLETLAPVSDLISARYCATTVTLRHCGAGVAGDRPFGTSQQQQDLIDLVTALGREPVHLVAWSYSAHAALALAADQPELVASLMVFEPGFPTFVEDAEALDIVQRDTVSAFGPVFDALAAGRTDDALRRAIDAAAGEAGWFDRQPHRNREIHRRNAHVLPLLATQSAPLSITAQDLRTIRCPTTVSWGTETRSCYRVVAEQAAALIPSARSAVIPGVGHLLPESSPAHFADVLRTHLEWAT